MSHPGIYLEMTDSQQLRPVQESVPLALEEVEVSASTAALVGRLYDEIWAPLGGGGRGGWESGEWLTELSEPGTRTWVVKLDGRLVGFAEMRWEGDGNVGIVVIGIVPSRQGKGLGGDFLTRMTRTAWETPAANGVATSRVWLWTRPGEHPHTIPNYLARGYRECRTASG